MSSQDQANQPSVAIPRWFLEEVGPRIREIAELHVMLAFFRIGSAAGLSEPVNEQTLIQDDALQQALRLDAAARKPLERIQRGIELAVARDCLLRFTIVTDFDEPNRWLLLATPENRVKLERYRSGQILPPTIDVAKPEGARFIAARPGVFKLYEQNIGLVTPIIADRLVEALELYPEEWIEDAIAAAVSYNRRNWRYIQRILETWATEGRGHEADRRHQPTTGDFDPEKHLRGEYAAVFRRRRRE